MVKFVFFPFFERYSSMSFLVIAPPGPEPLIKDKSIPFAKANLRAIGLFSIDSSYYLVIYLSSASRMSVMSITCLYLYQNCQDNLRIYESQGTLPYIFHEKIYYRVTIVYR